MSNPTTNASSNAQVFLAYCRIGFESECAQELRDYLGADHSHITSAVAGNAYVLVSSSQAPNRCHVSDLIFARQLLGVISTLSELDRKDRLTPILQVLSQHDLSFIDCWVETGDSTAGAELKAFCRSFEAASVAALRKAKRLTNSASQRLVLFFPAGDEVFVSIAQSSMSSDLRMGIPRLKLSKEAPSRSALKIEEAWLVMLSDAEREKRFKPGMTAVDLGAAPGGWSWQLARLSLRVTAIDNGPMRQNVLDTGLVTHVREDGFRFRPKKNVDWLVCDMVEQPSRITTLIAQWISEGWARSALFNLKLPMKRRYLETTQCLSALQQAIKPSYRIIAKQLYHDREEITVMVIPR